MKQENKLKLVNGNRRVNTGSRGSQFGKMGIIMSIAIVIIIISGIRSSYRDEIAQQVEGIVIEVRKSSTSCMVIVDVQGAGEISFFQVYAEKNNTFSEVQNQDNEVKRSWVEESKLYEHGQNIFIDTNRKASKFKMGGIFGVIAPAH